MSAPQDAGPPDGLLILDKPSGPTSHDVVDRARRALGRRRIGHAGTLDPLASGVLVLLVGGATRLSGQLTGHRKLYTGEAQLGQATDTYDRTGRPLGEPRSAAAVDPGRLRAAAAALTGAMEQSPPPFSARKVDGVPLYRRARRGEPAQGRAAPVHVGRFQVIPSEEGRFRFEAEVSAGTYIRSLVHDLGEALGCGAHLCELRREGSGPFHAGQALELAALEADPIAALAGPAWVPFHRIPLDLPVILAGGRALADLAHGRPFRAQAQGEEAGEGPFQVRDPEGRLVALAGPGPQAGTFRPRTVFLAREAAPTFTPRRPDGSVSRIE